MTALRRVGSVRLLSFAAALGFLFGASMAAAVPLQVTAIGSLAALTGGVAAEQSLGNEFTFIPDADGIVLSAAYRNDVGGYYVYAYQIDHYSAAISSIDQVTGISLEFSAAPLDLGGGAQAFYVTGSGDIAPFSATYEGTTLRVNFSHINIGGFIFGDGPILPGQSSHVFGVIHPDAPGEVIALVSDTGAVGGQAGVLSNIGGDGGFGGGGPVIPEPSAALAFSVGLGVVGAAIRRRRTRA